jgi:hypothetical protein
MPITQIVNDFTRKMSNLTQIEKWIFCSVAAHGNVKQTFTIFFSPWFSGVEKQRFSGVFYDQNIIIRNGS